MDGRLIRDVHEQLELIPVDATQLALIAGGNDVLEYLSKLQETLRAGSAPE